MAGQALPAMTVFEAGVIGLWAAFVATLLILARVIHTLNVQRRPLIEVLHPLGLAVGDAAPDFTATTIDGREIARSAPGGGDTVLAFLSARCRTCRAQAAAFRQVATDARERGFHVVAVINGTRETAAPLIHKLDGAVPAVLAPFGESRLLGDYRVAEFPLYLVVAEDGTVIAAAEAPPVLAAVVRR
jgi:peroxiredoxin